MKKIGKLTIISVISILALTMLFNKTHAHNVELDSEISLPMYIFGSDGRISVYSKGSNYIGKQ